MRQTSSAVVAMAAGEQGVGSLRIAWVEAGSGATGGEPEDQGSSDIALEQPIFDL